MSNRARDTGHIEREAAALLKATAAALRGRDMDRTFAAVEGDPLARGHAWRAIRAAIGSTPPVLWQRRQSAEAIEDMLFRAAKLALRTCPTDH